MMPNFVSAELEKILAETPELSRAYLVGGCVRDAVRQQPQKDFDIEVFGISYERLASALSHWGRTDLVGRSFGVVKLNTGSALSYDFTIPRRDSKIAPGHRGFQIQFEPDLTPREAAARRDFTINSLMYDPRSRELLDFFGGREDLEKRVLRHTSEAFGEDPLRVLRGMQFASRFELEAAPETLEICRGMKAAYVELAGERVRDEWFKWASQSTRPSIGLRFLVATGWIDHFPEIRALQGTPQDPEWHPEGDVFVHTCHCCDALVRLPEWQRAGPQSRIVYMLAVLAHDFAKPQTTEHAMKGGRMRIVSPGHEEAGGPMAEQFLGRIHAPTAVRERVVPLVTHHLAHLQTITDRSVRRLAKKLEPETIQGLAIVMKADHAGCPPKPPDMPDNVRLLLQKAEELRVEQEAPKPILMGRHLLGLGMKPGPEFGPLLTEAYEAQLEGQISNLDEAFAWLKDRMRDEG